MAWFVLMPLIVLFGSDAILYPAEVSVMELFTAAGTWGIWKNYIRYIGAGAVAAGGVMSLIKSLPLIVKTFRQAVGSYGKKDKTTSINRLNNDSLYKITNEDECKRGDNCDKLQEMGAAVCERGLKK